MVWRLLLQLIFFLYSSCLIDYGVVASINGPISINFGARNRKRVKGFMKAALLFNLVLGACIACSMYFFDDIWVSIFLRNKTAHVGELAVTYIGMLWPAFFISGINIVITGYFSCILKAGLSFVFSALRSLILPIMFIFILNYIFMDEKVFAAIPISEILTLICIGMYFSVYKRKR